MTDQDFRDWVNEHNDRTLTVILPLSQWVRFRPPTRDERGDAQKDPQVLRFLRVGSLGTVTESTPEWLTLQVGDVSLVYALREFRQTWIRAVDGREWTGSPPTP